MRMRATLAAAALLAASALLGWLATPAVAQEKKLEMPFTPAQLAERTLHRRGVEAVIWGMPAVNFDLLYQAMVKTKGTWNQAVYWSRLPDWKNQTLTPNPDTIYVFPFFNTNLLTIKDKEGRSFDGGSTYRLTVPANAPVKLYWSAVVYDRATHALTRGQTRFSRSSLTENLQKNADGSVDTYLGPETPTGKESNWVATSADGKFEVAFRFHGPEKPLFDKTWRLSEYREGCQLVTSRQCRRPSIATFDNDGRGWRRSR